MLKGCLVGLAGWPLMLDCVDLLWVKGLMVTL
jgi:hypothetical protein